MGSVAIIENDIHVIDACKRSIKGFDVIGHNVRPDSETISEIIDYLAELRGIDALYVSAQLICKDSPLASDYGGIELLKHLRFTPYLSLCRIPVIIALETPLQTCLHKSPDNIILFSPGCSLLTLPITPEKIGVAIARAQWIQGDESQYREIFSPFAILTGRETLLGGHTLRNLMGVTKLAHEFSGDIYNDSAKLGISGDHLWIKKMQFLHPEMQMSGYSSEDLTDLRSACADHSFMYIDDRHDRGWAQVLFAGLFGRQSTLEDFAEHGKLFCVGNYTLAKKYFKSKRQELDKAILEFNAAERTYSQSKDRLESQSLAKQEAQLKHSYCEVELAKAMEIREKSRELTNTSMQETGSMTQDEEISYASMPRVENNHHGSSADSLCLYGKEESVMEENTPVSAISLFEAAKKNLEQSTVSLDVAVKNLKDAEDQVKLSKEKISQIRKKIDCLLPFTTIFLDLRLQSTDELVLHPQELSGIKLLQSIKRLFPYLPVVVLTASEKAISSEVARAAGADGYWVKGISTGMDLCHQVGHMLHLKDIQYCWKWTRVLDRRHSLSRMKFDMTLFPRPSFVPDIMLPDEHSLTIDLLDISLSLMRMALPAETHAYYRDVVINMGVIQEMRLKDLKEATDYLGKEKLLRSVINYPKNEDDFRRFRNNQTHLIRTDRLTNGVEVSRPECTKRQALKALTIMTLAKFFSELENNRT